MKRLSHLAATIMLLSASLAGGAPLTDVPDAVGVDDLNSSPDEAAPMAEDSDIAGEVVAPSRPAIEAFQRGEIDECLVWLRKEVAQNPDSPPPRLMLAGLFLKAGQRAQSRALLEQVSAEDVSHPELSLTFANLALGEGRWTEALMHFEKMEQLGPRQSWSDQEKRMFEAAIVGGRAHVAEKRKRWDQAQALLAEWIKLQPENHRLRERRAAALFHMGREQQAFEQFDIAHQQQPRAVDPPEISMGALFIQQGEFGKANSWYERALAAHPDDASVRFQWAMALLYQDRAVEADKQAEAADKLGMDSVNLDVLRGIIARQLKEYDRAESHLNRALEESRGHPAATYHLVLALSAQDNAKQAQARALAERLTEDSPTVYWGWAALGWAEHLHGRKKQAEAALRRAMSMTNSYPEILFLFGQVLQANGNDAEAHKAAEILAARLGEPVVFATRADARKWVAAQLAPAE